MDTRLAGQRIMIIEMDDTQAPPPIKGVDGIGQIHVQWDNGSTLAVQPVGDRYQIFDKPKK
jgi:Domain of unknown function (DUF4314)